MEINAEQFARIEQYLPRQRGNVSHENLNVINAILFVAENGCKWRALPKRFGNWHTIYTRMNRWAVRVASREMLLDPVVASPELLPMSVCHHVAFQPGRRYGQEDDSFGAG
jgi:hypothetical protein